jgi:hypothetical protein
MPSVSRKQERFMRIASHDPAFAKQAGIDQATAREFYNADQAKRRRGSIKRAMADVAARARNKGTAP